jgi:hypothetical protein
MSSRYSQIRIAMDLFNEVPRLSPAGHDGDHFEQLISFQGDLPVPIPEFETPPRVIVTPVIKNRFDGPGFNLVTPVCAARSITANDFRLAVYSQDPDFGGECALSWVAIQESPDAAQDVPDLRCGVFPALQFAPFRDSALGNRTFRDHGFGGAGLDSELASVQLTATDTGVDGHSVAAAGMVDNAEGQDSRPESRMTGHNTDSSGGGCAFNWATFSLSRSPEPRGTAIDATGEPRIDSGVVAEAWFEAGGHGGDWRIWDIGFAAVFGRPPIVLLTPTLAADIPARLSAAVVGVVQATSTTGFRLAARSGDTHPGLSGFNWIAIGDPA